MRHLKLYKWQVWKTLAAAVHYYTHMTHRTPHATPQHPSRQGQVPAHHFRGTMCLGSLQSVTAPFALFVAVNPFALESALWIGTRDILVWATIVVTVWSAWPYLVRARVVLGGTDGADPPPQDALAPDPSDQDTDS